MMRTENTNIGLFILLIIMAVFSSCLEKEEFPIEPYIEFAGFTKIDDGSGIDNRGVLAFSYTDGDGDIGLNDEDTIPPYDYNLFIDYFEMQNGEFRKVFITYYNPSTGETDTVTFNARIPVLTPSGKNKAIKGVINDTLFINNYDSPYDTIKFDIYIKDRALHQSNIISTPSIIIKKN